GGLRLDGDARVKGGVARELCVGRAIVGILDGRARSYRQVGPGECRGVGEAEGGVDGKTRSSAESQLSEFALAEHQSDVKAELRDRRKWERAGGGQVRGEAEVPSLKLQHPEISQALQRPTRHGRWQRLLTRPGYRMVP